MGLKVHLRWLSLKPCLRQNLEQLHLPWLLGLHNNKETNITTIYTNIHYCLPEGAKESTPAVAVQVSITKTLYKIMPM